MPKIIFNSDNNVGIYSFEICMVNAVNIGCVLLAYYYYYYLLFDCKWVLARRQ
jgi:hypothetical protein